ncbi:MAG: hypothetical protein PHP57_06475 [Sideroxydans sp.]|nr:hypothetical protein [Sideroxydans sp.]
MNKKLNELLADSTLMVNLGPENREFKSGVYFLHGEDRYFLLFSGDTMVFEPVTEAEALQFVVSIFSDPSLSPQEAFCKQFDTLLDSRGLIYKDSESRLNAFHDQIFN